MICRIELLGGLRISIGDRVITRFRTQKAASLLAYLAYHHGSPQSRDLLVELLWPDVDCDSGRVNLRTALANIRREIEREDEPGSRVILSDRTFVSLAPGACLTDVETFDDLLKRASVSTLAQERIGLLSQAVDLYRGDLLVGCYDDWIVVERDRLRDACVRALLDVSALLEKSGDSESAIGYARRAVAADRLHEESCVYLIKLYLATGRHSAAHRLYEDYCQRLRAEHDADPGDALRDLMAGVRKPDTAVVQVGRKPADEDGEKDLSPLPEAPAEQHLLDGKAHAGRNRTAGERLFIAAAVCASIVLVTSFNIKRSQSGPAIHRTHVMAATDSTARSLSTPRQTVRIESPSLPPVRASRKIAGNAVAPESPFPLPKREDGPRPIEPTVAQPVQFMATRTDSVGYAVIEMDLPGARETRAAAVNDLDIAVGWMIDADGHERPFNWCDGVARELPVARAGSNARAVGIDQEGEIVGFGPDPSPTACSRAVSWDRQKIRLLCPGEPNDCRCMAMNQDHLAVGYLIPSADLPVPVAMRNGQLVRLATLGGAGMAVHVSEGDVAVGWCALGSDRRDATKWLLARPQNALGPGELVRLKGLGGKVSMAYHMNGRGDIVGTSENVDGRMHPCRWGEVSISDLGLPGGFSTGEARASNNDGQVVGSGSMEDGRRHAILWSPNAPPRDLNDLLPAGSRWVLTEATSINDRGWIVGSGQIDGRKRGFVMIPLRRGPLTVTPPTMVGGVPRRAEGAVWLDAPADKDIDVTLSSSERNVAESLLKHVTIRKGETVAVFPISTNPVQQPRDITIIATVNGRPRRAVLSLTP